MSEKYIILNARGTLIQVPIIILDMSPTINRWYLEERKDNEYYFINCEAHVVHTILNESFGNPQICLHASLRVKRQERNKLINKCAIL